MDSQGPQTPPAEPMVTPEARFVSPGQNAVEADPATIDLPEYEALLADLTARLGQIESLNSGLAAAAAALQLGRADLRAARGRLDTIAGELDIVSGETREATAALSSLDPKLIDERLNQILDATTTGLAGLAPLLTAVHDEASRAAAAATAAGQQAAEAATLVGKETAEAASGAATAAGQHAAAAAGEAGRQSSLRIDAAETKIGERLDLATDRLATDLGDLLTDRFGGVSQALAAQETRAQQGLVALQRGMAEQVGIGREATERGLAALHERAAAGPTAAAMDEGLSVLQQRLGEVPGHFDTLGHKVDATAAVADRAALTAQAAEQATRNLMANVESAVATANDRTTARLGGRLIFLLVVQILTLALVAWLAYLAFQAQ